MRISPQCLTVEVHIGLLNVFFYLKQKYIIGKSTNSPSVRDEFKTQLYFPVLDQFLQELNHRFQDQNNSILRGISACTPTASNFLCLNDLQAFSEKYGIAGTSLEVEVNLVKQLGLTTTRIFTRVNQHTIHFTS